MGFCIEDVRCGVIRVCVTLVLILRWNRVFLLWFMPQARVHDVMKWNYSYVLQMLSLNFSYIIGLYVHWQPVQSYCRRSDIIWPILMFFRPCIIVQNYFINQLLMHNFPESMTFWRERCRDCVCLLWQFYCLSFLRSRFQLFLKNYFKGNLIGLSNKKNLGDSFH